MLTTIDYIIIYGMIFGSLPVLYVINIIGEKIVKKSKGSAKNV